MIDYLSISYLNYINYEKLLLLLTLCICLSTFAQRSSDWTLTVNGKPTAIFTHQFTGVVIVESDTEYAAINPFTKSTLWTKQKDAAEVKMAKASKVTKMAGLGDLTGGGLVKASMNLMGHPLYRSIIQ